MEMDYSSVATCHGMARAYSSMAPESGEDAPHEAADALLGKVGKAKETAVGGTHSNVDWKGLGVSTLLC
jgi:hypothetical protein